MAKTTPRVFQQQMVHYLRKAVVFAANNTATFVGTLPGGAQILDGIVNITTVYNGTAPAISVGLTATTYSDIIAVADVTTTTLGSYRGAILTTGDLISTDSDVYARFTQTGTAATTGAAVVVLTYAVNNDG